MAARIDAHAPLRNEIRRIARDMLDAVDVQLRLAAEDHAAGLHHARKAIKRLRALTRLARAAAPGPLGLVERHMRDAARAIAAPREATAAVETLERFIADYPDRIVDCHLGEIRLALLNRRAAIEDDALDLARAEAATRSRMARDVLAGATFDSDLDDADVLAHGMAKSLSQWKKALARAERDGEALHDLRKAVKAHAAQLDLLRDFAGDGFAGRREAVDALGERLGELNDIDVIRRKLRSGALGLPDDVPTRPFDRLMEKHARRLAQKARRRARKLLDKAPARLRIRPARAAAIRQAA